MVNTHANGDHCYGNALLGESEIISSVRCAEEMEELPAETMAAMMRAAPSLGPAGEFLARIFAPFSFDDVPLTLPSRTFEGRLDLRVGDRPVSLMEVGPAHTAGDTVVHLPEDGVVFTGDILFHGGHPIVWAGPVANWIAACDLVLALQPAVVVPGHGPLATVAAVTDLKGYFEFLNGEARVRFDGGMSPMEAARDIDLGPYAGWGEPERLVANIHALYRDFGADVPNDALTLMGEMAALARSSWLRRVAVAATFAPPEQAWRVAGVLQRPGGSGLGAGDSRERPTRRHKRLVRCGVESGDRDHVRTTKGPLRVNVDERLPEIRPGRPPREIPVRA